MKKLFFFFFGCTLFFIPDAQAQSASDRVIFFDDFNAGTLNRTYWNVVGPSMWVNNEQQAYIDSDETIHFMSASDVSGAENGVLALRLQFQEGFTTPKGREADFVSGRINSKNKFDFTYGRAEARIKLPDAEGIWPAWWLLGNDSWPDTGEIDIMEYVGERDWVGVALHGPGYSGETPLVNKYFFQSPEDVTGWHVYAVEWSENQIDFLVDGRVTYRVTRPMVENYGPWRFDSAKYLILNLAVGGAYPYKTNGVETPYNGLPQKTVDQIKQGNVAMYVDWVRVTQRETP